MELENSFSGNNCDSDSDSGFSPRAPLLSTGTGNRKRAHNHTLSVPCKRAKGAGAGDGASANMPSPIDLQSLHGGQKMQNEEEDSEGTAGEEPLRTVSIVVLTDSDTEEVPDDDVVSLHSEPGDKLIDLNKNDDADDADDGDGSDEDQKGPELPHPPIPIKAILDLNNPIHQRELEAITALDSFDTLHKDETVKLSDFKILSVLGYGSYGIVYLVRKLTPPDMGALYAMKAIKKSQVLQRLQIAQHTKMERIVLQAVQRSRFLSQVHYAFQSHSKLYVVMEFIRGGDLFNHGNEISDMGEDAVRFYIAELVLALEELHKLGIAYRDIKPENILLDAEGHIVLADFGLSTFLSEEKQYRTHSFCGTLQYMAPEVLCGGPTGHGMAADWWSVGVLAHEMLVNKGTVPFESPADIRNAAAIIERIRSDKEMDFASVSPSGKDFVLCMLEIDEQRRLGGNDREASKIKAHPWFNQINWQTMLAKGYPTPYKPILRDAADVQNFSDEFTNMPAVDEESEGIPDTLKVFRGYTYVAPQHLDEIRKASPHQVHIEYCDPELNEIPTRPDGLILGPCIQRGSFSSCHVTIAHCGHVHGCIVAKVVPLCKFRLSELDALSACADKTKSSDRRCHPNIVSYYKTIRDGTDIWILMEYIRGVELAERCRSSQLDETACREVFRQILLAVRHVHSKHFIHGDIKPENIMFTDADSQDLTIKLIDFGNACYNSSSKTWKDQPRYTLDYAAPELLANTRYVSYSPAVDIYSLGATLYTMAVGHPPFRRDEHDMDMGHERLQSLRTSIQAGSFNKLSQRWKEANKHFRRLVVRCLNRDPAKRPKLEHVLIAKWVQYPPKLSCTESSSTKRTQRKHH